MQIPIKYAHQIAKYIGLDSTAKKSEIERKRDIILMLDNMKNELHDINENSARVRAIAAIKNEFPNH